MNDFKRNDRFGAKRPGAGFGKKQFDRPVFGGKPAYNRSGGGFGRPQVQMYPATCAQCNKATEVPFRPDGQRPLYCRDCLGGNKTSAPVFSAPMREPQKPVFRAPVPMPQSIVSTQPQTPDPRIDEIQRNLAKVEAKLDQVLIALAVSKALATVEPTVASKKKPTKKK